MVSFQLIPFIRSLKKTQVSNLGPLDLLVLQLKSSIKFETVELKCFHILRTCMDNHNCSTP